MQMNSSMMSQNTTARKNANFKQIIDRIKQITDDNDQLLDKIESEEMQMYEEDQKQAYMRRINQAAKTMRFYYKDEQRPLI